ncbi:RagB/SusD family nutrient uptake outer membrane protein [Mucilaginibacter corticis]|uniref:RagB/SusD family nutrient uptake outer membrane protein n=1 Tax=Mucilaginibacter corticis TaxID=2597670 RepID=A0A556M914_9SPHI|nr:RagB/SusD family nutrient uptake outer membrane protein [Mucilaginibacter corticis]TSJ36414.1 RagB/SusD family nutrient uptake outer membrane protein [Mucilaginibacter corticis]
MKRYKNITAVIFMLCAMTLTSCKKSFLEVIPKQEIVAVTYDDYNKLMNGSNFYMLGGGGIGMWQAAALMGDEVSAEAYAYNLPNSAYPAARSLFQWEDDVFPLNDPPNDYSSPSKPAFLSTFLSNMYTLNKIINEVKNAQGGTDQQKLQLQSEAQAERAFTNIQLVNYFTRPYNAATAATDPGFPVIKTADITVKTFSRGTVQQSYDFIISDLTGAIPNLPVQSVFQTRVSRAAAEAMLGKVYLFMGKYSDALVQFNKAFTDMAAMKTPPALYNYNQTLAPGGSFLPVDATNGPNSPFTNSTDVTESLWSVFTYAGPYGGNQFPTDFLTIPAKTINLFSANDWRKMFYTNLESDRSTVIPGGRLRRNNLKYIRIGVELPDLLLLKAEAEARTGELASAIADVTTLRNNRIPPAEAAVPASAQADATSLVKFIIEERVREFAVEGHHWFDMRRLSTDPIYSGLPAAQHLLYQDATNSTIYTLKPERLTLRLPPAYINQNPGMVNNP